MKWAQTRSSRHKHKISVRKHFPCFMMMALPVNDFFRLVWRFFDGSFFGSFFQRSALPLLRDAPVGCHVALFWEFFQRSALPLLRDAQVFLGDFIAFSNCVCWITNPIKYGLMSSIFYLDLRCQIILFASPASHTMSFFFLQFMTPKYSCDLCCWQQSLKTQYNFLDVDDMHEVNPTLASPSQFFKN